MMRTWVRHCVQPTTRIVLLGVDSIFLSWLCFVGTAATWVSSWRLHRMGWILGTFFFC